MNACVICFNNYLSHFINRETRIFQNAKLLGRNDPISTIDANGSGPIFIATRNDVLESIVDDCPPSRRKDLVFLQNGYLDDFLESKGLLDNTQVLLYLAVTALGAGKSALVLFYLMNELCSM